MLKMSSSTQEQLARRLTVGMALAVASSLMLVGWTLYKPWGPAPSANPGPVVSVEGAR
jgi:hypothetical protein